MCYVGATPYYKVCSQEVDWTELGDLKHPNYYCNYPDLPVSGSEGMMGS